MTLWLIWTGTYGRLHSWSLVSGRLAYEGNYENFDCLIIFAALICKFGVQFWGLLDGWAELGEKSSSLLFVAGLVRWEGGM